jgi:hypothetical protein
MDIQLEKKKGLQKKHIPYVAAGGVGGYLAHIAAGGQNGPAGHP